MNNIKALGAFILSITFFVAMAFLAALFIVGATKLSELTLPYINYGLIVSVTLCVVVFLPMSIFRATRPVAVFGFQLASYVFGVDVWMLGLLVTYNLWGVGAVFLGLFIAGVGVVPIGVIAAAVNGMWSTVGDLVLGIVLTYGARAFSLFLANKLDRATREKETFDLMRERVAALEFLVAEVSDAEVEWALQRFGWPETTETTSIVRALLTDFVAARKRAATADYSSI
jgi:hypothetical protein